MDNRNRMEPVFTSVWQHIREGCIAFNGFLSMACQSALVDRYRGMFPYVHYHYSGIWFGILAFVSGIFGIYTNKKTTLFSSILWLLLSTLTTFLAVVPMYFSAQGWQNVSDNTTPSQDERTVAALSGVIFFCGLLNCIFSLFSACSAFLLISNSFYGTKSKRGSPDFNNKQTLSTGHP